MNCPSCGEENATEAAFCAACGVPLTPAAGLPLLDLRCASCGEENAAGARFCARCGRSMVGPTHVAGDVPRATLRCAACGAENEAGSSFCAVCGRTLYGPDNRSGEEPARASAVEFEYVGFWPRLGAALIDGIILLVVAIILAVITAGLSVYAQWLIDILYYVLLTGLRGQTLGKQLLGIRVVNRNGEVPGIGRAILREVIGKFVSTIVLLLGYIWVLFDRRKQGWHDKIAGTYVIRVERTTRSARF